MESDSIVNSFFSLFSFSDFNFISTYGLRILVLLVLITISFGVSGSEVALFSLSKTELLDIARKHKTQHRRLEYLLSKPKEVLVSLLLINTFVNIGIILLMNILLRSAFSNVHTSLSLITTIFAEVFLLVIFAEITPKIWASKSNVHFVLSVLTPFYWLFTLILPLARLVTSITKGSEYIMGKVSPDKTSHNAAEFNKAIALTSDKDHKKEEILLLQSVVHFKNITVKQVMRNRLDITAIEQNTDFPTMKKQIIEYNYSRLPIYKKDLDTIVGVLYVKDILPHLDKKKDFKWTPLIRPPFFIYEFNSIETLLTELKKHRLHFAVVLDEFGTTQGIITLEDIVEEIVGDINDEFDEDNVSIKKTGKNTYVAEGKVLLNDFAHYFRLPVHYFDEVRGENDSLAGFFLELAQKIPDIKEKVSWDRFTFTAERIQKNRITKIKVEIAKK